MGGKIIIPMYRLWLHGLYGLYGPQCPLSPKRLINLISLSCNMIHTMQYFIQHCNCMCRAHIIYIISMIFTISLLCNVYCHLIYHLLCHKYLIHWTQKRYPITYLHRWSIRCLLWIFWREFITFHMYIHFISKIMWTKSCSQDERSYIVRILMTNMSVIN